MTWALSEHVLTRADKRCISEAPLHKFHNRLIHSLISIRATTTWGQKGYYYYFPWQEKNPKHLISYIDKLISHWGTGKWIDVPSLSPVVTTSHHVSVLSSGKPDVVPIFTKWRGQPDSCSFRRTSGWLRPKPCSEKDTTKCFQIHPVT